MKNKIPVNLITMICFVFIGLSIAQARYDVRMAYFNPYFDNEDISTSFLERAKKNGYNYIHVVLYPWFSEGWNNGRYNNGNYNSGKLYEQIKGYFELVNSYGMKMIPEIQLATPDADWVKTGNSVMENYLNVGRQRCAVPVLAPDNRTNGFGRTFQDVMEVIDQAFHDANLAYQQLDYMMLIFDEAIKHPDDSPLQAFWGKGTRDLEWMQNNSGTLSDLVAASFKEKIDIMNGIGRHLSNTKMMTWASMFEPEGYQSTISDKTTDVPKAVKDAGIENKVIFVQWWYSTTVGWSYSTTIKEYDALYALEHLTAYGSKVAFSVETADINDGDNFNNDHLISIGRTINAANSPSVSEKVIGYASGHFCVDGYQDGSYIGWSSMEYLAYWTTYYSSLY